MKITSKGVKNFAAAVTRIANKTIHGESVLIDIPTRKKRMSICEACEYLVEMQCSRCECLVRAKTMLRTEKCPEGKW